MTPELAEVTRHPSADQLLDLVLGLLPPELRRELLDHLGSCADCEQHLREISASHERARSRQVAVLGGPGVAVPGMDVAEPAPAPRSRWLGPSLAIAAALVAVTTLFVMSRPPSSPTVPAPVVAWLPRPDPGVLARGGAANGADSLMLVGLAAYERHELALARRSLEGAHTSGVMEQVRRVYLANTLLQLGAALPALDQLRSLDYAQLPEPWRSESRWALGQALAGSGHSEQADSLMRQLASEPGLVGERARAGLQQRAK